MVNEQVTTIELAAGTPEEVKFAGSYPYYWVINMSDSEVYAAVNRTPEADADGTYTIVAGEKLRISGGVNNSSITLLGEGKVQVIASGIASCPFKSAQGGGGIKYINGIAAVNGTLALTQSLIPSDGTAYQMPYYIQSGTLSVDANSYKGINITFPKAFKEAPLLLFSATYYKANANLSYPIIANYSNLTKNGFTLVSNGISSGGLSNTVCIGTVNWVALGVMEEDTDG